MHHCLLRTTPYLFAAIAAGPAIFNAGRDPIFVLSVALVSNMEVVNSERLCENIAMTPVGIARHQTSGQR